MALLSDIRSGLLGLGSSAVGAGQSIGRGIGRGAGLFGQQLAQPLAQGVRDIPDVMRFYEAQRMAQPMMSYDPADLRPVTPMGVAGMLPTLRAAEQEGLLKPRTEEMRQSLLQARIDELNAPPTASEILKEQILQARLAKLKREGGQDSDVTLPPLTAGLGNPITAEELASAPTVDEAAQGDVFGLGAAAARRGLGFLFGAEVGGESASARDYVLQTNKEMQVALTKDLGGRLTKVVKETVDDILPRTGMVDTDFRSKATRLIEFSNQRIQEVANEFPRMTPKEKQQARDYIDVLARQTRKYEAILAKSPTSVEPSFDNSLMGVSTQELRDILNK